MRYDVCIVGGGIAGSMLAYELSTGFRVCVVEEKGLSNVGKELCPGAVERSWFKGFSPEKFGAVTLRIKEMRLWVGEKDIKVRFDGYVLNRHRFCRGLLTAAIANGCDLVEARAKAKFEGGISYVLADDERIEAGLYVDASGSSAVLRKHYLSNEPWMFSLGCMETVDESNESDELDVYLLNHVETGWVFPAEYSTNVGLVTSRTLDSSLEDRLESLKRRVGLMGAETLEKGYRAVPSYRPIPLVYNNLVAIGDAGFTVNPITCGGIGPSVLTANLLAESLKSGESPQMFEERYWELLGRRFWKLYRINRFLRSGQLPIRWAVSTYYSDGALGKLIKRLLRI